MRKLIKKILKESNDLQWINDIKSHQDIAQEITDETRIDYDEERVYTPFSLLLSLRHHRSSPTPYSYSLLPNSRTPSLFSIHCREVYGLNDDDDIHDVWERYKKLVRDKVKKRLGSFHLNFF